MVMAKRRGLPKGVEIHRVRVTGRVPKSGRPIYWAFGLADYADLFGVSVEGLRTMIKRGKFDPKSLKSLCKYWSGKKSMAVAPPEG